MQLSLVTSLLIVFTCRNVLLFTTAAECIPEMFKTPTTNDNLVIDSSKLQLDNPDRLGFPSSYCQKFIGDDYNEWQSGDYVARKISDAIPGFKDEDVEHLYNLKINNLKDVVNEINIRNTRTNVAVFFLGFHGAAETYQTTRQLKLSHALIMLVVTPTRMFVAVSGLFSPCNLLTKFDFNAVVYVNELQQTHLEVYENVRFDLPWIAEYFTNEVQKQQVQNLPKYNISLGNPTLKATVNGLNDIYVIDDHSSIIRTSTLEVGMVATNALVMQDFLAVALTIKTDQKTSIKNIASSIKVPFLYDLVVKDITLRIVYMNGEYDINKAPSGVEETNVQKLIGKYSTDKDVLIVIDGITTDHIAMPHFLRNLKFEIVAKTTLSGVSSVHVTFDGQCKDKEATSIANLLTKMKNSSDESLESTSPAPTPCEGQQFRVKSLSYDWENGVPNTRRIAQIVLVEGGNEITHTFKNFNWSTFSS